MALTGCKECGKQISTEAAACPHCGAPKSRPAVSALRLVWYAFCALVLLFVYRSCSMFGDAFNKASSVTSSSESTTPSASAATCSAAKFTVKSMRARFVDECGASHCFYMKGVAVLTNTCDEPMGVQVKITGLDSSGAPVASRDLWPASISNIPPGDYTVSLDHYLDYDARIKSFTLQPIDVRNWRR